MLIEFLQPDFRFDDARGSLVQLVREGWKQVNVIRSEAGVERGGHYHAQNSEAFYVISGSFTLTAEDLASGEKETLVMKAGDFFRIRPHLLHGFHFHEETWLVSMYDRGVELEGGAKDILTRP